MNTNNNLHTSAENLLNAWAAVQQHKKRQAPDYDAPLRWVVDGQEIPVSKNSTWYHGSASRLSVGDTLMPPSRTKRHNWTEDRAAADVAIGMDAVFITPCLQLATVYAGGRWYVEQWLHRRYGLKIDSGRSQPKTLGSVYAVVPLGRVAPDTEDSTRQFRTPRATIIEVAIPTVTDVQVSRALDRLYHLYEAPKIRGWIETAKPLLGLAALAGLAMAFVPVNRK